ncbi:MAG: methyltransferase [Nitrospinaceae bacterium]|nr:methyltransferase [Nitrospinaceae bacterium]NIR54263.1 methyltransferase [Nitrospinaceae bacterium]NIS84680.1 methyltransferase [Nitrospinaceae bacterium]NIT81475.1 methyltransferase [Nitrospinaceae bacterium]NIU43759.1 methyltransferase [Nitrospinaceae bacterium]
MSIVAEPLNIQQDPGGYRYSYEPFLLANWILPEKGARILDIGTGCGVIPMLLITRQPALEITAVEIQPALYRQAVLNIESHGMSDRIRIFQGDYREWAPRMERASFDWILSNPPYRKINSGKINPNQEKAVARHELMLNLEHLVVASAPLLKDGGKLSLAYPFERMAEVKTTLTRHHLPPGRSLLVFGQERKAPKICLIEGVKGGADRNPREETLTIRHSDGNYTNAMKDIYASFNYPERTDRLGKK